MAAGFQDLFALTLHWPTGSASPGVSKYPGDTAWSQVGVGETDFAQAGVGDTDWSQVGVGTATVAAKES